MRRCNEVEVDVYLVIEQIVYVVGNEVKAMVASAPPTTEERERPAPLRADGSAKILVLVAVPCLLFPDVSDQTG